MAGFLWGTSSICAISRSSDGDSGNCSPRIQLGKTVHYLPILFIDQLSNRVKDLMVSTYPPTGPARTHPRVPDLAGAALGSPCPPSVERNWEGSVWRFYSARRCRVA